MKYALALALSLMATPVLAGNFDFLMGEDKLVKAQSVSLASCPCGESCACVDCKCEDTATELRQLRAYKAKMEAWLTEQGYRNQNVQWARPASVSTQPYVILKDTSRGRVVAPVQYDCSSGQCVPVQSNRYIGNGWFSGFKSFRGGNCAGGSCR